MLLIVVLIVGVVAAGGSYLLSATTRTAVDPIDPAVEERGVQRFIGRHPSLRRFIRDRFDRQGAGGFMLTVGFLIVFAVAVGLGVLLQLIHHSDVLTSADKSVSEWGSTHASSRTVDVLKWITQLGTTRVVIGYLAIGAIYDFVRRRNSEVFLFVAVVGLGQLGLNTAIKALVRRDRPAVLHLVHAGGFSFPSGHSCAAAAATSAVALILGRGRSRRVRAALASIAALLAISVATSRALLGVHWLSDVIAGLILGWGWFLLVAVVFGGRRQRLGDPVEPLTAAKPAVTADASTGRRSAVRH